MELDIGAKIQSARKEAELTQEAAAELIGVSRQTISNWENNKSYPDIISVIKMSEIYKVSLDYLLKGEKSMADYYDYLKESTDVVSSNAKKGKIILVSVYVLVYTIAMMAFWLSKENDGGGFAVMYMMCILPLTTLVAAFVTGVNNYFSKKNWLVVLLLAIMYMLAEYFTFGLANNIAFGNHNLPDISALLIGLLIGTIGILTGLFINKKKQH